jgi:hypothetical protein
VLLPIFAPNENSHPAGLEEVTPQKFRKGQLSDRQHQALAKMKQYTDFNDLATKSVLGSAAVERQMRPIIQSLIERRQARSAGQRACAVTRKTRPDTLNDNTTLGSYVTASPSENSRRESCCDRKSLYCESKGRKEPCWVRKIDRL